MIQTAPASRLPRTAHSSGRPPRHDELVQAAIEYQHRGWSIIPVRFKKAALKWEEFQKRRMSEAELRKVIARPGVTGIAVVLGPVSGGLCCRDFDELDAYEKWAAKCPGIAATLPTVRTPRGAHVYFLALPTYHFKKLRDGEFRTDGNYCVLPPSLHPTRLKYAWVDSLHLQNSMPTIDPVAVGLLNSWGGVIDELDELEGVDDGEEIEGVEVIRGERVWSKKDVVKLSIPKKQNENHDCLFVLARARLAYLGCLKSQDTLGAEDDLPLGETYSIFEEWYGNSTSYLDPSQSKEEYWSEFLRAVALAKVPLGAGVDMNEVIERAKRSTPPPIALEFLHEEEKILLVKLCRELWTITSPSPFWLSSSDVAKLIGFASDMQAYRALLELQGAGIIKIHTRGNKRKATRYVYLLRDEVPIPVSHTNLEVLI